ncbi:cell division protein ZipA [Paraphotobacterium marinum]|uniref:Cell division protein ZipA n=1 Tax=Paraphotobacterium marinum TaxID=1755811 RepID=A0A220VE41_9GAMM|nr:cell division protein ZipA [Paraphotobacterium marinum]ASK78496.1 cell division protein ZipA [Paraphotobacterium marinum]
MEYIRYILIFLFLLGILGIILSSVKKNNKFEKQSDRLEENKKTEISNSQLSLLYKKSEEFLARNIGNKLKKLKNYEDTINSKKTSLGDTLDEENQDESVVDDNKDISKKEAINNSEKAGECNGRYNEVIILNVHANEGKLFSSSKFLPILEKHGLKFGEMSIFHYKVSLKEKQLTLFSVANMVSPGTFEDCNSRIIKTPGLSFFMEIPSFADPEECFNFMLQCAQQVADSLSGNVLDEGRNLLTPQRIENYRKKINEIKQTT